MPISWPLGVCRRSQGKGSTVAFLDAILTAALLTWGGPEHDRSRDLPHRDMCEDLCERVALEVALGDRIGQLGHARTIALGWPKRNSALGLVGARQPA